MSEIVRGVGYNWSLGYSSPALRQHMENYIRDCKPAAMLLFDRDVPGLGVPLPLLFGLAASSAAMVLLGGGLALPAHRAPVVSGPEEMIGATGEVEIVDGEQAWARVHGESWLVRAATPLTPGQRVRVRAMHGLTLEVRPIDDSPSFALRPVDDLPPSPGEPR